MGQNETKPSYNGDLDVEITNLDEADAAENSKDSNNLAGRTHRFAWQHKRSISLVTIGVGLLAILLIVFSSTPVKQLFSATAPALSPPEQTMFPYTVETNPPWTRLFIDGRLVQPIDVATQPGLISLTRGRHTLTWRAQPFAPQQCVLDVPVGSGIDTCNHPEVVMNSSASPNTFISFPASLSGLTTPLRTALVQTIQAALDSEQSGETLRAGERYALTSGPGAGNRHSCIVLQSAALCFAASNQELKATLSLQLDTDTSRNAPCDPGLCNSNGQDCRLLCDESLFFGFNTANSLTSWQATGMVHLFWQFSTLAGQEMGHNQANSFILGMQNEQMVPLNITWDGQHWSVTIAPEDTSSGFSGIACEGAIGDMDNLVFANTTQNEAINISQAPILDATPASGCMIRVALQSKPTSSSQVVAYVMQRFGVLLAVNSMAHRQWPFLPVANAYEKQLAKQWAAREAPVTSDDLSGVDK